MINWACSWKSTLTKKTESISSKIHMCIYLMEPESLTNKTVFHNPRLSQGKIEYLNALISAWQNC